MGKDFFLFLARVIIVKVTLELFKRWMLMTEKGESEIFLETWWQEGVGRVRGLKPALKMVTTK